MPRPYTVVKVIKTIETHITVYDDEVADQDADDASALAFDWAQELSPIDWDLTDYEVEEVYRGED